MKERFVQIKKDSTNIANHRLSLLTSVVSVCILALPNRVSFIIMLTFRQRRGAKNQHLDDADRRFELAYVGALSGYPIGRSGCEQLQFMVGTL